MRGKLSLFYSIIIGKRSIPAHAGETRCSMLKSRPAGKGPSPRMRGKHRVERRVPLGDRSIPAHAGETPRLEIAVT